MTKTSRLSRMRAICVAATVVAALCASFFVSTSSAQAASAPLSLGNGVTKTNINTYQEYKNGVCRAGTIDRITGPVDIVKGIHDSVATITRLMPGQHRVEDFKPGNLLLTTWVDGGGICKVDKWGRVAWLRPVVADLAYTGVYIAVTAVLEAGGFWANAAGGIENKKAQAFAGCVGGGLGLGVNNAILGVTNWQEILSGTITGCVTGAGLAVGLKKAPLVPINSIRRLIGRTPVTYDQATRPADQALQVGAAALQLAIARAR